MYKIIALDMDGTLLNEKKKVTDRTKKALQLARDKGVKVVLASGRPIDGLKSYLNDLDLIGSEEYVLSYNGCLVQETKSERIIYEKGLTGEDLLYIYKLSRKYNVNIHAFSPTRGLITPKISKYTEVEAEINGININVCDFSEIDKDESIIKIMLIDEPEILDKAIQNLPKEVGEKYNLAKSTPYFFEIINKESNKGIGLKALANHLGVDSKEVIAVGDAGNDLDMINYAGLGVAMANGHKEVKEVADFITKSNEEDGVAEVVDKFILD